MKKTIFTILTAAAVGISMINTACTSYETYAEQKEKEKKNIENFINNNELVGKINVISESQFEQQDSTTNLERNEFVLFEDDGVYMQIVKKGGGKSIKELAREMPDSTVSKVILCRFLEYDIQNSDTTRLNIYTTSIVDKMLCTYSLFSRQYTASFTEGYMMQESSSVPKGWLKPLDYIGLTRDPGNIAKVRIIVPHTSGTVTAVNYVMPYYYEISYQLGK